MKLILISEVKSLGLPHDVVNVAEGYARNYLIPRKLAVPATEANLAELRRRKETEELKSAKALEEAKGVAERLEGIQVTVKGKVGAGTKLYGAITPEDIAKALEESSGIAIDKRKVELEEPIKSLGTYEVPVRLHGEAAATIKVEVVADQSEESDDG